MVVINKFWSQCGDSYSNMLDHWFHEMLIFSNHQKHLICYLHISIDDPVQWSVGGIWSPLYKAGYVCHPGSGQL